MNTADIWKNIIDKIVPTYQHQKTELDKLGQTMSKTAGMTYPMDDKKVQAAISSQIDAYDESHKIFIEQLRAEVKRYTDENITTNKF